VALAQSALRLTQRGVFAAAKMAHLSNA
jgi:hypothetical protein